MQQRIRLLWKRSPLFHEAMAEGQVEVESTFTESFGQGAVVCIVEMVVQLEADAEYRICCLVAALAHVKQRLTKVAAKF